LFVSLNFDDNVHRSCVISTRDTQRYQMKTSCSELGDDLCLLFVIVVNCVYINIEDHVSS